MIKITTCHTVPISMLAPSYHRDGRQDKTRHFSLGSQSKIYFMLLQLLGIILWE